MSKTMFELDAMPREDLGRSASRRLRREEKVLGIVYGGKEAATPIELAQNQVKKAIQNDAFFSHILNLNLNGKNETVVLKDLQRHPVKSYVMHMDFLRVNASDVITMHIPLHYHGEKECKGVANGGVLNHHMVEVELRCQAGNLPEHLDVDVSNLDLDDSIHLSQLKIPANSELVMLAHGHDEVVASVHIPRKTKLDEEQAAEEEAAAAAEAAAKAESEAKTEEAGEQASDSEAKPDSEKE